MSHSLMTRVCTGISVAFLGTNHVYLDLEVPVESPSHRKRALKSSRHAFDIPVEVPYRNATRDVTGITSASSFDYVLSEIRERMDATPSQLAGLAYIPSYKPRNPKPVPKLLSL